VKAAGQLVNRINPIFEVCSYAILGAPGPREMDAYEGSAFIACRNSYVTRHEFTVGLCPL
jgi:hypothetical protein